MYITEPERKTPVRGTCDTAVVGGGIAGVAAALAAARTSARTLLIERKSALGGLATLGLVTIYLPLCDGMGHQVTFGIAEELLRLSVRDGIEGRPCPLWLNGTGTVEERRCGPRFSVQYNPWVFAIRMEQLLEEAGVTLLYETAVTDVVREGNRITHLIVENKSGRGAYRVERGVVDASGDADVAALAGVPTAQWESGNTLAAWYYHTEGDKNRLCMLGYAEDPTKSSDDQERLIPETFSGLDAEETSRFLTVSHAHTLEHFLAGGPYSETRSLASISMTPQFRMTRRIEGRYTMRTDDPVTVFPDSIGVMSSWRKAGPVYEVPFRALCAREVDNLLAAGRNISASGPMWDLTRVIPVCALTGQAAGTAAALSEVPALLPPEQLSQALAAAGVRLHLQD